MFAKLELELPMNHKNLRMYDVIFGLLKKFQWIPYYQINLMSRNYGDLKNCNGNING